jgi:hypothetical protein
MCYVDAMIQDVYVCFDEKRKSYGGFSIVQ